MKRLKLWWISNFKIITTKKAQEMGLMWERNVYGDEINHLNCRSIWIDVMQIRYRVHELFYPDGIENYFNHKKYAK